MVKGKKTIQVESLRIWANNSLKREDEFADQKFKAGICNAIERILHDSDNYRGFSFLHENQEVGSPNYYSRYYF